MFCHNCGNECPEGAAFCNKCGTKLVEENKAPAEETSAEEVSTPAVEATSESKPDVAPAPTPVVEPTPAPGAEQPKKKKANVGLIVGLSVGGTVIALVIAAAILTYNFFYNTFNLGRHGDESNQESIESVEQIEDDATDDNNDTDADNDNADESKDIDMSESSVFLSSRELNDQERARQAEIAELSSYDNANSSADRFDLFENSSTPKSRDNSYKWDNTCFYALEGLKSSSAYTTKYNCDIKRFSIIDKNGHDVEVEAFINPSTGVANKIVYIEYVSDGIKVREFYYTNYEKPSFVFDYKADNYVSSYATPDQSGNRYLFHKDTLVTYRKIKGSSITNISVGSNESNRMRTQFSASQRKLLKNVSADAKADFKDREDKWLDAAYNVYNLAMNAETNTRISGYVYYANGDCAPGVHVGLFTNDFGALLSATTTDSDGYYQFVVPDNDYNYMVKIISNGYYDECIYDVNAGNNQVNIYIDTLYLFDNEDMGRVQLILGDAVHYSSNGSGMQPLKHATVRFRRGFGNRTGDVLYTFKAGSDGIIDENVAAGNYCIQIDCDGFTTMYYNIVVNPEISINRYECYATPTLRDGEVRIVLTWGEYPQDLDSHLFVGSESHTWYGNKDNAGNDLDVDDTSSYGPETITIYNLDRRKYYKYCVCDYTNLSRSSAASYDMSYSDATVFVYDSTGLLAKYNVPYDTSGTIWEVFEIRKGQINSIQRYYNNDANRTWWHHD